MQILLGNNWIIPMLISAGSTIMSSPEQDPSDFKDQGNSHSIVLLDHDKSKETLTPDLAGQQV